MAKSKKIDTAALTTIAVAKHDVMIPSGCTLLDLACTDTTAGFCSAGHCVNSIGDRNAGKTMQALASMAETYRRYGNAFEYKFYDTENAYSFDTAALFGKKFAATLQVIPVPHEADWCTQALANKMIDAMSGGKPQYFVIDSMDNLRALQEYENDDNGVLGGALALRAVANKYLLRRVVARIATTGSFLIYLSQAAESIGFGAKFTPKIRGGGKSLGFYAFIELWLSKGGQIKVGDVKVGDWTVAKIARSKANGKAREVWFPIFPAYGIDDTRANLDWLYDEGVIVPPPTEKEPKKKIYAVAGSVKSEEADDDGKKKKKTVGCYDLTKIGIDYVGKDACLFVESNGLGDKVAEAVKTKWAANEQEVIDKTFGGRKSRYD